VRSVRGHSDETVFKPGRRFFLNLGDPWLFFALLSLLAASLTNLFGLSASMGSALFYRQLLFALAGFLVFIGTSLIKPQIWKRAAPWLYSGGLFFLLAVLLFGSVRSGTRGWFVLGSLTLQPSEFARVPTLLLTAVFLHSRDNNQLGFRSFLSILAIPSAAMGLILLQPDFGVALTYLPILALGLWLGGLPRKFWVVFLVCGFMMTGVTWFKLLRPYQKERVLTVLDSERDPYGAGYQGRQSRIAVGSGGWKGQGLGKGSQSVLRFLPAQHTDFAFAAWAEATGFIGSSLLFSVYALLFWRIGYFSWHARDRFGVVLPLLTLAWLAFQFVINTGMILGWLPTTGITLPLFSYGGSSLLSSCATLGLVNALWRSRLDFG